MKKTKFISLLAAAAISVGILTACSSNDSANKEENVPSSTAEVYAGATAGTTDFSSLQKGFDSTGAWLNATTGDIDASDKILTVNGLFSSKNQVARKLALYTQNEDREVTEYFTLAVEKIVVNSAGFYISNGIVKGDVQVNAAGFHGQTGKDTSGNPVPAKIDGNLYFASQALLDAYNNLIEEDPTQAVEVTGETEVKEEKVVEFSRGLITIGEHGTIKHENNGSGSDVETGATANTTSVDTFTKALSEKGTWIAVALEGTLDASGETITVAGTFMAEHNVMGRKIALYNQNESRQVTAQATLKVDKLIINSPQTYISNGIVVGDVHVSDGATNFHAQNGRDTSGDMVQTTIEGNLYFASQDLLDAYNKLPDNQKFEVTGEIGVKK